MKKVKVIDDCTTETEPAVRIQLFEKFFKKPVVSRVFHCSRHDATSPKCPSDPMPECSPEWKSITLDPPSLEDGAEKV